MTPHIVGRVRQSTQVVGDGLVLAPYREGEMGIVRFRRAASRPLVHHEIAAVRLNGRLESLDRLHHVQKLVGTLSAMQVNPKSLESAGQFARNSAHIVVSSCARFVRLCHRSFSLGLR
jgi:hypothetical protein